MIEDRLSTDIKNVIEQGPKLFPSDRLAIMATLLVVGMLYKSGDEFLALSNLVNETLAAYKLSAGRELEMYRTSQGLSVTERS